MSRRLNWRRSRGEGRLFPADAFREQISPFAKGKGWFLSKCGLRLESRKPNGGGPGCAAVQVEPEKRAQGHTPDRSFRRVLIGHRGRDPIGNRRAARAAPRTAPRCRLLVVLGRADTTQTLVFPPARNAEGRRAFLAAPSR